MIAHWLRRRLSPAFVLAPPLLLTVFATCCAGGRAEQPGRAAPTATALASPSATPPSPTAGPPSPLPTPPAPSPAPSPPSNPVDLLTLVDKDHALAQDYVPTGLSPLPGEWVVSGFAPQQLRNEALDALIAMLNEARTQEHDIRLRSGYRSYATQAQTFDYWVSQLGPTEAARVSARAGHSEHQLGTAADLTAASVSWQLVENFGSTPEGAWLAARAAEYGFVLSYPAGAEGVTGYAYEPWHFRYVGPAAAAAVAASGHTLTEYLRGLAG